jgi:hypothetical protein
VAYVALSRRESICLLRNFDKCIFTWHPLDELRDEDERLAMEIKNKYDIRPQINIVAFKYVATYLYMGVFCTHV